MRDDASFDRFLSVLVALDNIKANKSPVAIPGRMLANLLNIPHRSAARLIKRACAEGKIKRAKCPKYLGKGSLAATYWIGPKPKNMEPVHADAPTALDVYDRARKLGLREVARRIGLNKVRGRGMRVIARCPYHDDHNPSFSLSVLSNGHIVAHCFAGCALGGKNGGNLLHLVARMRGLDTKRDFVAVIAAGMELFR